MRALFLLLLVLCCFTACRERYGLPMEKAFNNSLVVEGNILQGDSTVIRLSRTTAAGERQLLPETGASISVEGDDNSSNTLLETEPGVYKVGDIPLNSSAKYRLKITSSGKEYESEWTSLINTSDIDTLYWERNNGVQIYVKSTGGDDNNRYYKWDYDEVWDFYSKYKSYAYFTTSGFDSYGRPLVQCVENEVNGIRYTTCVEKYNLFGSIHNDSMYHCWKYGESSNINIGSTAALSENVILAPVRKIEQDGFELTSIYSILVKQTGLSRESYEFYKILKGNTEGMGSIFDAQPSQLKTNLRCISDPTEIVFGFIDATSVKTKRLYINNSEVGEWNYNPFSCFDTIYVNSPESVADAVNFSQVPVEIVKRGDEEPYIVSTYTTSSEFCVDCRLRGSPRKPDFWP